MTDIYVQDFTLELKLDLEIKGISIFKIIGEIKIVLTFLLYMITFSCKLLR